MMYCLIFNATIAVLCFIYLRRCLGEVEDVSRASHEQICKVMEKVKASRLSEQEVFPKIEEVLEIAEQRLEDMKDRKKGREKMRTLRAKSPDKNEQSKRMKKWWAEKKKREGKIPPPKKLKLPASVALIPEDSAKIPDTSP